MSNSSVSPFPPRHHHLLLLSEERHSSVACTSVAVMASSDQLPQPTPAASSAVGGAQTTPGKPMTLESKVLDAGAQMLQSMKPLQKVQQHACTFALYSHDLNRQIEAHLYASRLNEDFLQCAVYDSDLPTAHLIGVEYIISDRMFETLPSEEQRLWHSHAFEVKSGLWVLPRVPELVGRKELQSVTKTYGKFWCTWQVDRGDRLPMGSPALMMSPQGVEMGKVKEDLVHSRDVRYGVQREKLKEQRVEMEEPEWINPNADYWRQRWKGLAIDVQETEMTKRKEP